MFSCSFCAGFSARTFKRLLHHIKFVHSNEPNFLISCVHCNHTFRKFESFKSHLRRKHRFADAAVEDHIQNENLHFNHGDEGDELVNEDEQDDGELVNEDEQGDDENCIEKMTRFIALFILKIKEESQLTQVAVDAILGHTESLVEQSLQIFKDKVRSCLDENNIDIAEIEGLSGILDESSAFSKAMSPVANEYLQVKYFVEKFNFVVSI